LIDTILFHLDLRTLFLLLAGIGGLVALVFANLARRGAGGRAARCWAAGHGVAALGYLMYALRGAVPDLLSVVLGNTLILAGAILILRGLRRHLGQPFADQGALLAFFATGGLFLWLTYGQPHTSARVVLVSVVGGAVLVAAAASLLAPGRGSRNWGHWFTANAFAVAAAGLLVRGGLTLTQPPLHDLMGAPFFHGVAKAILAVAVAAWSLGFLWLITLDNRRALEREVAARTRSEAQFRAIFDASPAPIAFSSLGGRILMANAACGELLGRNPADLSGHQFLDFSHPEDLERERPLFEALRAGERSGYRLEKRFLGPGREPLWVDLSVSVIPDAQGNPLHLVGVANEIGERKRTEAELQQRANYDRLTGVLTRLPFEHLLAHEQERVDRYGSPASLLMLDIDHFKAINDTHGHELGDEVLRQLVGRVRERLRESDTLARWGGEEFLVLLPETDADGGERAAEAIRQAVAGRPLEAGPVTVSLGVAQLLPHEPRAALIRRVDAALYGAKAAGRNRVERAVDHLPSSEL
jgi:diguanylate cyclase (GGDEF)-like protein/PAS domain S-box-containing protein